PFAIVSPGGLSSERWPAERFARLAAVLAAGDGPAILVEGSADETPILREIEADITAATAAAGGVGRSPILICQDPLDVFAALLARARLLVTNDSAPLHFAAALGVPVLYLAQREKLAHSHPRSPGCWALYDDLENDLGRISVEQVLGAVRDMVRRGVVPNDGSPIGLAD
ncbi:MAG: glycosyltransferase family 9 protein, partial [Thermoanaerobaculia bacterium]